MSGVFRQPFTEQVAFFRRKLGNLVPTQRWDDMLGAAHDDGFMVAGAAKADLLTDLAAATDKAIAEGTGIEAFRKDFRAIVRRNGWTGWTGEGSVKGEAWRVGVIYRTNAYTSYAAGRRAQLVSGKFDFWVYRHGGSVEPRPEHLGWDGTALPPGDAFWVKHYPPSDWGCSCYVVGASSERAARRLGATSFKRPANWNRIDPRTGAPVGIGRGWDYAPGANVAELVGAMARKVGSWDYQIAKAFMGELAPVRADALADAYRALPSTADDVRRYAQRVYEPNPELRPLPPQRTLGPVRSDQVDEIAAETGRDLKGYDFSFDQSAIGHVIRQHGTEASERRRGQRRVAADDFARLPEILSRPDRMVAIDDTAIGEPALRFSKSIDGETFVAIMAIRGGKRRTLALKTFYISVSRKRAPGPTS